MRRLLVLLVLSLIMPATFNVADAQTAHVLAGDALWIAGAPIRAPAACAGDRIAARAALLEELEPTCKAIHRPPKSRPGRVCGHVPPDRRHGRAGATRWTGLSVIIPTKNRPLLLRRALDSFVRADAPLEIIVVDDGSIGANARSNRSACERLRGCRYVLQSPSKGAAAARNHGFRLSQGAYIWFMDDDDYATAQTVADVLEAVSARTGPEILLLPRATVLDGTAIGLTVPSDEAVKLDRYRRVGTEVTTSCALFPRSVLVRLNGWDESLSALQDTDLFLRAAAITTFASLPTEPVRVDTGAPDRITYLVFASLIGKAQFLRKHWHFLPVSRRLGYIAQILCCTPLLRAARRRWKMAALRRERVAAAELRPSL
jgi:hypothetical protein